MKQRRFQNNRSMHRTSIVRSVTGTFSGNSYRKNQGADAPRSPRATHHSPLVTARSGSALVVIIGLLGLLSLLGFFFYSFAKQEASNARYFADASKVDTEVGLSPELLFDFALRQLILGANSTEYNSVLRNGEHSLLPNMFGRDLEPYSGTGFNIVTNANEQAALDVDYDGTVDTAAFPAGGLFEINNSRGARGSSSDSILTNYPQIDGGYTYPDGNNVFLAYNGYGVNATGAPVHVVIPSFHRPQYLRQSGGTPYPSTTGGVLPWDQNTATSKMVLRPHESHLYIRPDGTTANDNNGNPATRFLTSTIIQGLINDGLIQALDQPPPFPFTAERAANADLTNINQGVWDMTNATLITGYEFDADPDGDNIKEAVWLDLDFPVQEFRAKWYIPLFAITVYDADSLLNLNTHGNTSGNVTIDAGASFGSSVSSVIQLISKSNQGLSAPSAVNPLYALNALPAAATTPGGDLPSDADVDEAFAQHKNFFKKTPATTTWREAANMEFYLSLIGKASYETNGSPSDIFAGRWGDELTNLVPIIFQNKSDVPYPGPGRVKLTNTDTTGGTDDNNNQNEGEVGGRTPFGHPLDYSGTGDAFVINSSLWEPRFKNDGPLNRWRTYSGYSVNSPSGAVAGARVNWLNAVNSAGTDLQLVPAAVNNSLQNEPEETIVEARFSQTTDQIFGPSEMFVLHAGNTDRENTGASSRLLKLMSWNLAINTRASAIRKRFTTSSWDLSSHGKTWPGTPATSTTLPASPANLLRPWEFDEITGTPTTYEFPPTLDAVTEAQQPFRQAVRKLLKFVGNLQDGANLFQRRRLSINHLAELVDPTDPDSLVEFRRLTDHPSDPGSTVIPVALPAYPPTTPAGNERWARYDRQLMARDIYTLLYVLCGPQNTDYLASNATRSLYTDKQLEQMAQFAINVVDYFDPDDVIDAFEYDKNLGDGWGLDDNPYGPASGDTTLTVDRSVVYGVEAQRLTYSEILAVNTKPVEDPDNGNAPWNHIATQWNDQTERYFTYVELRNTSPFPVNLGNGAWQIEIEIPNGSNPMESFKRQLTFKNGAVTSGGVYSILSSATTKLGNVDLDSPTTIHPSHVLFDLTVDAAAVMAEQLPMAQGSYTSRMAPADITGTMLDLISADPTEFQLTEETSGGSGPTALTTLALLDPGFFTAAGGVPSKIQFVLRRRAHIGRTSPTTQSDAYDDDNPWIEVDHLDISLNDGLWELALVKTDTGATVRTKLETGLRSRERIDPLARVDEDAGTAEDEYIGAPNNGSAQAFPNPSTAAIRHNSVGSDNRSSLDLTPARFTRWQPHFDRDFASVMELMSIPMYGPKNVTRALDLKGTFTAGNRRFLTPTLPSNLAADGQLDSTIDGSGLVNSRLGNLWYRLFSFVEVPSRMHRHKTVNDFVNSPGWYRHPGKLNLNTMRYPEILAGLIDDEDVFTFSPLKPNSGQTAYLADTIETTARDWWVQFIRSRDLQDTAVTNLYLPGMSHSRPFRDFSYLGSGPYTAPDSVLNDTLLRGLDADLANTSRSSNPRALFELGTWNDHNTQKVDYYTSNRILSKIHGNTTNRSNVFYVFVEVQFFEAYVDDSDNVRIGGKLEDSPRHRGFFVIDRSLALEQIKTSHLRPAIDPTTSDPNPFSFKSKSEDSVNGFDHNGVIIHRQTIE